MNQDLIKKYGLRDFEYILKDIFVWCDDLADLDGKSILELGPGTKLNLLKFFQNETNAANVHAVGKTISQKQEHVKNAYLLPHLKREKSKQYDLIYSRHLFEANSIHPLLLLKHPAFWKTIIENRFDNPGRAFPSSIANMQSVFIEAYRILKPGGLIVSQIAKRKYSSLTTDFLKTIKPNPSKQAIKELGRYGLQVILEK